MLNLKSILIIATIFCFGIPLAFAYEAIPITYSGTRDHVQFDGKWTFEYEWKESSLNQYSYENGNELVILRSAHQGNFVYILLDVVSDESLDIGLDKTIVCFDTKNDKNIIADYDDFCFMAILGQNTGITYQGDHTLNSQNTYKEILNYDGFIGIGTSSDENDRYSGIPHATYEFKIPTDLIGRSSVYGFNFAVFDENTKKFYTYPDNITTNNGFSSPAGWGEIYSPDKSLPEFYLVPLVMVLAIIPVVLVTRIKKLTL